MPNRFSLSLCWSLVAAVFSLGASSCSATGRAPTAANASFASARALPASFKKQDDDGPKLFAKEGFFVGVAGVATTLSSSDFDGQSGLVDPLTPTQWILPELDPGYGWGFVIGYRGESNSVQYTYNSTTYDDDFMGTSLEDDIKTYSLEFKHYWNVENAFQPYALIGVSVPRIRIEQGVSNGAAIGDGTFQGLGANLGGGAALYITPQLSLFGEAYYRWADIEDARGLGVRRDIDHRLDGSGIGLRGGLSFTL